MSKKFTVGMIGMGWIGSNYTNDFKKRGYKPVCYAMEPEYVGNKEKIKDCDFVFIAVPTPTTPKGFDDSILKKVIKLVGKGKTAVIKSTVMPGKTLEIQKENPDIFVVHSPEFLTESSAGYDAAHPKRNIIGIPKNTPEFKEKAEELLKILPKAPYNSICSSTEAELIKYARNCVGYLRVIFNNMLYDASVKEGADWKNIKDAISADPDNGPTYTNPVHKSGRGAGGHCFIKDFSAFANYYEKKVGDKLGIKILRDVENKNIELLTKTQKDLDLLEGVYGKKKAK